MERDRLRELERALRSVPKAPISPFDREDGYTDGLSDAEFMLDRTLRSISLIADNAVQHLLSLGWNRKSIDVEVIQEDPLPCWVRLRKRRVCEVRLVRHDDGRIHVQGEWIVDPPSPGIIDKFMGH